MEFLREIIFDFQGRCVMIIIFNSTLSLSSVASKISTTSSSNINVDTSYLKVFPKTCLGLIYKIFVDFLNGLCGFSFPVLHGITKNSQATEIGQFLLVIQYLSCARFVPTLANFSEVQPKKQGLSNGNQNRYLISFLYSWS